MSQMTTEAFTGLRPARGVGHASWVLGALIAPPEGGVSFRVPPAFPAVVRVHHELHEHNSWSTVERDADTRTSAELPYPLPDPLNQVAGELDEAAVDTLVPALRAATGTAEQIHFAQWLGWGDLRRGSRVRTSTEADSERGASRWVTDSAQAEAEAVYRFVEGCPHVEWWGGRTMFLFDGPIDRVASIGSPRWFSDHEMRRRSPQWWWPRDRSWFVATEIDDPCSYIAGDEDLIDAIERLGLDTVRVLPHDRW